MTPLQCAQASWDIYYNPKRFNQIFTLNNIIIGWDRALNLIAYRGSVTPTDWITDFKSFPVLHPMLGWCETGFVTGLEDDYTILSQTVHPFPWFTGHSLGGARARLMAARFVVGNRGVGGLMVFGSPKPGFQKVSDIIGRGNFPHTSYRNRADIVPTLAETILPLFAYTHPDQYIPLDVSPDSNTFESFRDHSMDLYLQGVQPSNPQIS